MNIENALCPAQQARAVLELVIKGQPGLDDAALHALYSVSDNLDRVLQTLDEIRDYDNALFMALTRRGIYDEVMAECAGHKPEPDRLPLAAGDTGEWEP